MISLGGKEFHSWQRAPSWLAPTELADWEDVLFWKLSSYLFSYYSLVNLVHSVIDFFLLHRMHYIAPRLRRGAPLRCLGSAWGVRAMKCAGFKKVKVKPAMCTLDDCVTMTQGPLNCINDTECLENLARFRRFATKLFRNRKWFSNFSVLCECCWWKLLVRCKTLIYCGQLCGVKLDFLTN
jgi:hypothetical protein